MSSNPFPLSYKTLLSNFKRLNHPHKVNFACTYRCNLRCRTCNIWKKKPPEELRPSEIERIFSNLKTEWVNLTGGEPFIMNDLPEIVNAIKEKSNPYIMNVTTNGFLTDKITGDIKEILRLGIPRVLCGVSIDGPEETHDRIRGVRGSWKRAVATYKELKPLSCDNFKTFISYTVSSMNADMFYKAMGEIKKSVSDIGEGDFHFNIYHTSEHYYSNSLQNGFIRAIPEYFEKYGSESNSFPLAFLKRRYVQHVRDYIKNHRTNIRCASLSSSCFIDSVGNVYPCIHYNKNLGNLRDHEYDINRIWNNDRAKAARREIVDKGCPGCWTPCEAYQTILANLFH